MIYATSDIEKSLWIKGYKFVCGVDEVGRGCFAGPVVAGAVVFAPDSKLPEGIADSKLLKPLQRKRLSGEIKKSALCWSVGIIDVEIINALGIGGATQAAFVQAVNNLSQSPDFIIIDAFYINKIARSMQNPIKKGDRLSVSIAAASIIAKVFRDELMEELDSKYPGYGFSKHKGYGTKDHRDALKKLGLCSLHRASFNLTKFL